MIKVGVAGARGYSGEELLKILLRHSEARITELSANIEEPEMFSSMLPFFKGKIDILCRKLDPEAMSKNIDIVFLCLPHKLSMEVAGAFLKNGKKVIDLSADYRLSKEDYERWYGTAHKDPVNIKNAVYGMPELFSDSIKTASLIANPGCYPTSIILAMAPALKTFILETSSVIIDAKSGATGAGRKADIALNFCEVNENIRAYKVNEHQHQGEINSMLSKIAGEGIKVIFTPHLLPMNRGILSTIYLKLKKEMDTRSVIDVYKAFYSKSHFVRIMEEGKYPQTKDVANTNYCDIGMKASGKDLIIVSCIDNLVKGAAGQAVQNMNIMYGFKETEGLM